MSNRTQSPLLIALSHPVNLATLVVAIGAGLISAWWLFPGGLVVWAVMVWNIARDPTLRLVHTMDNRAPLAQRFQRHFDRIERQQVGLFNSLDSSPAGMRRNLEPLTNELEKIVDQVYALCRRMTTLENYRLVSNSNGDLESDLRMILKAIETAPTPLVRQEYEESRRTLEERLNQQKSMMALLDRVEAQLFNLNNEINGVVTAAHQLQTFSPKEAAGHVPGLVQKLKQESLELDGFEREALRFK